MGAGCRAYVFSVEASVYKLVPASRTLHSSRQGGWVADAVICAGSQYRRAAAMKKKEKKKRLQEVFAFFFFLGGAELRPSLFSSGRSSETEVPETRPPASQPINSLRLQPERKEKKKKTFIPEAIGAARRRQSPVYVGWAQFFFFFFR